MLRTICICLLRIIFPELLSLYIPLAWASPPLSHQISQVNSPASKLQGILNKARLPTPTTAQTVSPQPALPWNTISKPSSPQLAINHAYFQSGVALPKIWMAELKRCNRQPTSSLGMQPPPPRVVPANPLTTPQFLPDWLPGASAALDGPATSAVDASSPAHHSSRPGQALPATIPTQQQFPALTLLMPRQSVPATLAMPRQIDLARSASNPGQSAGDLSVAPANAWPSPACSDAPTQPPRKRAAMLGCSPLFSRSDYAEAVRRFTEYLKQKSARQTACAGASGRPGSPWRSSAGHRRVSSPPEGQA